MWNKTTKYLSENLDKLVTVIFLFISFFSYTTSIHSMRNIGKVALIILFVKLLVQFIKKEQLSTNQVMKRVLIQVILPYLVYYVYSVFITILNYNNVEYLLWHSTMTSLKLIITLLLGYFLTCLYKDSVNMITHSLIISNCVSIIYFIFSAIIVKKCDFSILEIHEVTYCLGLVLLFRLINTKKVVNSLNIIIIFFIIIGCKKITFLALLICFIVYLVYRLFLKLIFPKKIIYMFSIITFIVVCLYLLLSTTWLDFYIKIVKSLNINTMGRIKIYSWLKIHCPGYHLLGSGIGYTDMILSQSPIMSEFVIIHNDILRIFIEGGLIFFILWFINFIVIQTKRIYKNCGIKPTITYFFMVLFTVIHYMTDNVFIYPNYTLVFYGLLFHMISNLEKNKE